MNSRYAYAFALAVVAIATVGRLLFLQSLGSEAPFVTFLPAVAIAALFCGFRSGVSATVMSAVVAGYFWIAPGAVDFSEVSSMTSFLAVGILISYIALIRDRARNLEAELRDDREKLALFVQHAPAALAMFDREMRYLSASRRWISAYTSADRELTGLSHYEVFPDLPEYWKEVHRRGLSGEVVSEEAERFQKPDGSVQWYSWEVRPWCRSDGSVGGIIIFIEDITRRKQDEDRLKELTQQLSYHMDNSPLAVVEWGADMRLIRWAGAAESMFGWKAEEVLGKRIEDLPWVYAEDRLLVTEVTKNLAEGTDPTSFSANRNYRKDGSVISCEWYNSSLLDDSGRLKSILSLVLDVTDRKNLEESLEKHAQTLESEVRERTAELMEKNRLLLYQSRFAAMGEMLNTIAHQWRQPLNVLGLHIQNLSFDEGLASKDHVERFVGNCMNIVQHMSRTIDDFRDFFKPEKDFLQSQHPRREGDRARA